MSKVTFNRIKNQNKWYKGNLHCHTTESDGKMTPYALMEWYKDNEYDFLGISDHRKVTQAQAPDNFLAIRCVELGTDKEKRANMDNVNGVYHVVGIGMKQSIESPETANPQELIDTITQAGGLAFVAHPHWSANLIDEEFLSLKNYIGLECYNTYCDIGKNKGVGNIHWDSLLSTGKYALGFATDDHHGKIPNDIGGGWIMVNATELTEEAIIDSIKQGSFYSSSGPEIYQFEIIDNKAIVKCSPAKAIHFIGKGSQGKSFRAENDSLIEEAEFELDAEDYIRIEVMDTECKTAWTNPVFLK